MLFYTHLLIGILLFLLVGSYFHGGNQILFLAILLLGSILPDIDETNSKVNRGSGIVGTFLSFFFKHRGIFHSFFFALAAFVLLTAFWSNYYAWAFFLGYLGHLLADAITPMGIQVFYPLSKFRVKGPIKVGSIFEWLILAGLVAGIVKMML